MNIPLGMNAPTCKRKYPPKKTRFFFDFFAIFDGYILIFLVSKEKYIRSSSFDATTQAERWNKQERNEFIR